MHSLKRAASVYLVPVQVRVALAGLPDAAPPVGEHEEPLEPEAHAGPGLVDVVRRVQPVRAHRTGCDLGAVHLHVQRLDVHVRLLAGQRVFEAGGPHDIPDVGLEGIHGVALRAELNQVHHGEFLEVAAALGLLPVALPDLEDPDRAVGVVPEPAHDDVQVRGQHGPQGAPVVDEEHLPVQRVVRRYRHLGQLLGRDERRRADLQEAACRQRVGYPALQR